MIDGLDQVVIDPGIAGTPAVFLLTVARDGDDHEVLHAGLAAEPLRNLITVESRQSDVEQHDVGMVFDGRLDGPVTVMGDPGLVPEKLQ